MKAILVIDIPDYINTVTNGILKPIGTVGKLEIGYGSDDGEMTRFEFINTYGALLKPLPQKKKEYEEKISRDDDFYEKGWNDCIDEILGDEK